MQEQDTVILFSSDDYLSETDLDLFDMDWSFFRERLLDKTNGCLCVLQGTQGLWNGRFKAGFCGTFEDALDIALRDKDDFKFEQRDKELWLTTYHHDGFNEYHIKQLTEQGEDLYDQANYDSDSKYYGISEEKMHDLLMQANNSKELFML